MGKIVVLYHYTDKKGYDAIKKSKKILKSSDTTNDAVYGAGVYLTSLSPNKRSKIEIAENNYDGIAKAQERHGKVDYWFEFYLPEEVVSSFRSERDIWLYKGKDLCFSDYPATNDGDFHSYGALRVTSDELATLKTLIDHVNPGVSATIPWMYLASAIALQ